MGKIAFAGPWYGEFGWEIVTWQAHLRLRSHDFDKIYISTFPGMEPLYAGFHCEVEFMPHAHPGRGLDWTDLNAVEYTIPDGVADHIKPVKQYRLEGEHVKFGNVQEQEFEILLHGRGISKASNKNYDLDKWASIASNFPKAASIGSENDYHVPGTVDRRGLPLQELMDLIASVEVVVGQSSGVMHLASLCGIRHVVWGDDTKTHFGEPLRRRYEVTWNPLNTPVSWVNAVAWNPEPDDVIRAMLDNPSEDRPPQEILQHLKAAMQDGRYIFAIAYYAIEDKNEAIKSACIPVAFPLGDMVQATDQVKGNMDEVIKKEIERSGLGAWKPGEKAGEEVLKLWR